MPAVNHAPGRSRTTITGAGSADMARPKEGPPRWVRCRRGEAVAGTGVDPAGSGGDVHGPRDGRRGGCVVSVAEAGADPSLRHPGRAEAVDCDRAEFDWRSRQAADVDSRNLRPGRAGPALGGRARAYPRWARWCDDNVPTTGRRHPPWARRPRGRLAAGKPTRTAACPVRRRPSGWQASGRTPCPPRILLFPGS